MIIKSIELSDFRNYGKLDIHFNSQYSEMSRTEEVILRAAVVQSLGQVTGVDYVYNHAKGFKTDEIGHITQD